MDTRWGPRTSDNPFDSFSFAHWAPSELREHCSTWEVALNELQGRESLRAAFCLFWMLLDASNLPDKKERDYVDGLANVERVLREISQPVPPDQWRKVRQDAETALANRRQWLFNSLEALLAQYRPSTGNDGGILQRDALLFGHIAAALAASLKRLEGERSERFVEVAEEALRVLRQPQAHDAPYWVAEDEDFSVELTVSALLVEAWLCAVLLDQHALNERYDCALGCLAQAAELSARADKELYYHFEECVRIEDAPHSTPRIWCAGVGFQMVQWLVPAQRAVDALVHLLESPSRTTSWADIWSCCCAVQDVWQSASPSLRVTFPFRPFDEPARDFWVMAKGLVLQKMNPGDLVHAFETMTESQIEKRLRVYFFPPPLWERLPDKARMALVSADREYESPRGSRSSILDHLVEAVRAVLVKGVVQPFMDEKGMRASAYAERDLSEILGLWNRADFQEYLDRHYDADTQKFLRATLQRLSHLNALNNKRKHDHLATPSEFEVDVKQQYALLLGIGCEGILPRLLALRSRSDDTSAPGR